MNNFYKNLVNKINKYNNDYYINGYSAISDRSYDKLISQLKTFENKYELKNENSPTSNIGSNLIEKRKVKHTRPMLSLENAYEPNELIDFDERIKKELNQEYNYVCELKIDGVAISLKYSNGQLIMALTRGDGITGNDITEKISTIKNVLKIKIKDYVEIRGEVYTTKKDFKKINIHRPDEGKAMLVDTRGLTAGTLNSTNINKIKEIPLKIFAYNLFGSTTQTQTENLIKLKQMGLKIEKHSKECITINDVIDYCNYWKKNINKLNYNCDGVVVKVNSIKQQNTLGEFTKCPNWAFAFKF